MVDRSIVFCKRLPEGTLFSHESMGILSPESVQAALVEPRPPGEEGSCPEGALSSRSRMDGVWTAFISICSIYLYIYIAIYIYTYIYIYIYIYIYTYIYIYIYI